MTLLPSAPVDQIVNDVRPTTLRWQPLRLGLCNLFHYDSEVFPFRDGRLLLRGNNGAGKSKVLALTLPFLLDGDTSARRIEPDADPGKRMEWNLLMGGEYTASERVGYSWLEFGRLDEVGDEHFVTIGAGLKAAKGQTGTKSWFFITGQRVGDGFGLVDANRTPLGIDRLAGEIGANGHVYKSKRDYRHAVDEKLFELGERRYDALMDLLIQIRAPQLSKRPSEKLLSDALTESLTPIPQNLVQSVADGMRGLDEYREELQQFVETRKSVDAFLSHYATYARVLVKRQAEGPRRHQADYDTVGRLIIELTATAAEAERALADTHGTLARLQRQQAEHAAENEALRDSEFAGLDAQLKTADATARRSQERRERARKSLDLAESSQSTEQATAAREAELARVADTARDAAMVSVLESARDAGLSDDGGLSDNPAHVAGEHGGIAHDNSAATAMRIAEAREALHRVRELLGAVEKVTEALRSARQRADSTEVAVGEVLVGRQRADESLEQAADDHITVVESYVAGLTELTVSDEEFERFAEWTRDGAGENPVRAALADSAAVVVDRLSAERTEANGRLSTARAEITAVDARIAALERGETPEPPASHTRDPALSGLAFWRAVSFHESVGETDRAGVESALEASGLLTAVFGGSTVLREPAFGEVVLRAKPIADSVPTLADLMRVELPADSTQDPAEVRAVLASIAVGSDADNDTDTWVSATGRFRMGVARGAWSKPAAMYVGESARADARARSLADAVAERAGLHAVVETETATIAALASRLAMVRSEQQRVPESAGLDAARRGVVAAGARVAAAEEAYERATADLNFAQAAHAAARDELEADAQALGLPTDPRAISARLSAVDVYANNLRHLWDARERSATAHRVRAEAEQRLDRSNQALVGAGAELEAAQTELAAATAAAVALRSRVGEDVLHYRARVDAIATEMATLATRETETYSEITAAVAAEAIASEKLRQAQERQLSVATERVAAVDALRRTAALGLVEVAIGETAVELRKDDTEWTVTHGVQIARAIETALADVDASVARFERVQSRLVTEYTVLQPALGRQGNQSALHQHEDGYQVLVVFSGQPVTLPELAARLAIVVADRERLLNASEREVIENHLVAEVGTQLSELVGEADAQIANLNTELSRRPTSTGMKLRVRWKQRADGPAGLSDARARLSKIAAAWDGDDRRALGEFLQARIAEVRESDESGNWYDSLGDALDYRRWHQFVVERYQGGIWKPATGPASGGERVLAASIPLFAAASSHYRTAGNPYAPRMVMLDEAFAGVDDNARASCLGLLAAFDLDVVMTSEREWGCYAEVPGLSIAQLSRFEDTPAILVQLWSWDGRVKMRLRPAQPDAAEGTMW